MVKCFFLLLNVKRRNSIIVLFWCWHGFAVSLKLELFSQCASAFWFSCDLAGLFHRGGLPMTDVIHLDMKHHETSEKALEMVGGRTLSRLHQT